MTVGSASSLKLGESIRALVAIIVVVSISILFLPRGTGSIDLLQYWSSSRLIFSGQNPYDPVLTEAVQRSVRTEFVPTLMWNPPTIFFVILPLLLGSFSAVVPIWFAVALLAVIWAAQRIPEILDSNQYPSPAWVLACLTFVPIYSLLYYGQLSHVLLVAWIFFLASLKDGDEPGDFRAGLAASFFSLKPHLFLICGIWIARKIIVERRPRFWAGLFTGLLALIAVPLLLSPHIFAWYQAAISDPPFIWKTPTLGSWLQELSGNAQVRPWPLYSALLGSITWILWRRPKVISLSDLCVVLGATFVFAPYGWLYDQVLLLPVVCLIVLGVRSLPVLGAIAAVQLYFLMGGPGQTQSDYLWYPPILTALALLTQPREESATSASASAASRAAEII